MSAIRVRSTVATVAVVLCLFCGLAQGATIFVKADASGANDGTSWSDAFTQVQPSLEAAVSGDEVWVAAGTYVENITLKAGVALYGGFAGNETELSQRDCVANKAILDGNQAGSVVTSPPGATATSRVDGFTIRNGKAYASGGIFCNDSSPTIANNVISGNSATGYAGAILCGGSSSPMIVNNTIAANTAGAGGIFCAALSSAMIVNNTITGNTGYSGGGIHCQSSSSTIAGNTISGNAASESGGGIYINSSSPKIVNNGISGNTSARCGGGIYCFASSSPIVADNTIIGNTASDSGGGIYCFKASPTIANSTITGNNASSAGGICCDGYYTAPTITNTIIVFNSSGISNNGGSPTLRYACVYGNAACDYCGVSDPTGTDGNISSDPLFARSPSSGPDGQWGTADDDYGNLRLQPGSPCIDAGDNTAVPADTLDLDDDGDVTEPIPFDLAGMARFIDDLLTPDTGVGAPPIVDMGAYEYAPVVLQSAMPASGKSLWRNQKNIIRLTFDADIVAPDAGAVMIQEMIAGGAYGDDLSAGFTFTVEDDGQGQPRVLKIWETGSSLSHRKWYAVRNTGAWADVAPFTVQYVVQVGDANNDGRVLNTDFGWVNAAIPTFSTADDDRRDINGDGRILNTDFGVLNSKIPSFPVAKPSGH